MEILSASEMLCVAGGEVGATGMGDNYHYTGERSFMECVNAGMSNMSFELAANGGGGMLKHIMFECILEKI